MIERFILTFLTGLCCGTVFFKIKVPGGMMVGAVAGVAAMNIAFGKAFMPGEAKLFAQCLAGAFIACSVSKSDLKALPRIIRPAVLLLSMLLGLNLLLGAVIHWLTPLDFMTACFSCVPGGMSDVPIIAADMGADAPKVALMQFVRMSSGIGIFPQLIMLLDQRRMKKAGGAGAAVEVVEFAVNAEIKESSEKETAAAQQKKTGAAGGMNAQFLLTVLVATAFGFAGKKLGVPAGALVFSMFSVIVLKLRFERAYLPLWAKRLAQVLSGAYIGCSVGYEDVLALRYLWLPACLILAGYFLNSILTGYLLRRFFRFPFKTSMLAATPAGATDMALISADLGVQSPELIELQIIRMVVAIAVFPQVIWFLSRLIGA